MTVLFNGGFEQPPATVSQPYLPWGTPQSHNWGNPTDNANVHFGNWYSRLLPFDTAGLYNVGVVPAWPGSSYCGEFQVPVWTAGNTRSQLITSRSQGVGTHDWFTLMFYAPIGWSPTIYSGQWGPQILEVNFQALNGAPGGPFALTLRSDHVSIALSSGNTSSTASPVFQYRSNPDYNPSGSNLPFMYAIPIGALVLGKWNCIILHIYWSGGTDGVIEAWYKTVDQGSWTQASPVGGWTGFPTCQVDPATGLVPTTGTLDVIQHYRGPSTADDVYWLDNFTRSTTQADALAQFPSAALSKPVNTVLPSISGTLKVGQTLTCNEGTWNPVAGSYYYQWRRADDNAGANAAKIVGATGRTYVLQSAEQSKFISVDVTGNP
jgi:hypothetical protein